MTESAGLVGLISNPASGHNRNQFAAIAQRIAASTNIIHIETASAADIEPALARLAEHEITTLAINGGDGTVSAVLGTLLETGMFQTLPRIALLPGGTANMNAGDIGIRGSLRKAVERFCQWCEADSTKPAKVASRRLMRVATATADAPRYGMFLGGGAVIHGTQYAHENIHSRGLRDDLSLALGVVRTVWGVLRDDPAFNRHIAIQFSLDNEEPVQFDTLILVVSTLHRLAFGMRPFWSQQAGDVRLTVFEQGCSRFVRTFISIVRGKPSGNAVPAQGYHSFNNNRIALNLQGQLNLDGEIFEADGLVEITASAPLEFLQL